MAKKSKYYSYEEAVSYLENKGIGCDPCIDIEGELVCDLLDEEHDESFYTKSTLDEIAKEARKYRKEQIASMW